MAAFTATPPSGTAVLTVTFDASQSNDPDGSIARYEWQFPGGATATGAKVEHRFEEAGDFDVTLRVVDDLGASAAAAVTIKVEELPRYQVAILGTVGEYSSSVAVDINERGDVAGALACDATCSAEQHGFFHRDGQMIDIGTLGGRTFVADLNNLGQITGSSMTTAGTEQAFLYSDGKMVALPPYDWPIPDVPSGTFWLPPSRGAAINDEAEIVGRTRVLVKSQLDSFECRGAFHWDQNGEVNLVWPCGLSFARRFTLNADAQFINQNGSILVVYETNPKGYEIKESSALVTGDKTVSLGLHWLAGLNDRDSVAGRFDNPYTYTWGAFLYQDGEFVQLPSSGDDLVLPTALNNTDQVVGIIDTHDGNIDVFLYSDGSMSEIGTFGKESGPTDLNDNGEFTGVSVTADGQRHAVVYTDGRLIDLGTLGGLGADGRVINNLGQVAGTMQVTENQWRAFLATPIRLLLTRLATEVKAANVDAILLQRVEAAAAEYAARNGPATCAMLVEFRARVQGLSTAAISQTQATAWTTKSQDISTALRCP